jgi:hypothetical protein
MITTGTKRRHCLVSIRNSELNHQKLIKIKFFLSQNINSSKRNIQKHELEFSNIFQKFFFKKNTNFLAVHHNLEIATKTF